jgi:hypothetical protein
MLDNTNRLKSLVHVNTAERTWYMAMMALWIEAVTTPFPRTSNGKRHRLYPPQVKEHAHVSKA